MSDRLTLKQRKFTEEICKGASPSQAYIKAYNPKKSTKKTIAENASKLLKNTKISPIIKANQEKLNYTALESFNKIQQIQQMAFDYKHEAVTKDGDVVVLCNPDLKTALKAEELKGKLANLYSNDKVEVNNAVQIVFSGNMNGV